MDQPNAEKSSQKSSLSIWKGDIRSLSQDGKGVGTIEIDDEGRAFRRPIFIPFTAPGDTVEAEIIFMKGKYYHGKLLKVVQPSSHRIAPLCPHYTACGGCDLEHIDYDEQVRQKASQLQFLLSRKNLSLPHAPQVISSIVRHKYRRRSKVALRFEKERIIAGFRKHHSHDIIPVTSCFIVTEEILAFINLLNATASERLPEGMTPGTTIECMVAAGENGKLGVLLLLSETEPASSAKIKEFFDNIYGQHRDLIGNLFFEEEPGEYKTGGQVQEHLTYSVGGMRISFSPEVFIQANIPTNELLVQTVLEFIEGNGKKNENKNDGEEDCEKDSATVIDLYCGIGNFSLPIARKALALVGVEGYERSVELAKVNAAMNSVANATFLAQPIEEYMREQAKRAKSGSFDAIHPRATHIIIDPPRTGCTPPVLDGLLASGTEWIVYVSCDPDTLANDLTVLSEKYAIADIVGVDMFPDISHLETVVLLRRKGG
jgi:23S rRNA (uracil1939-C5)-methyltransferase